MRGKRPSCYLYLAFLLQVSAFGSLLAGYCTPYWTAIRISTGNVRHLGLVVTCDVTGCDLLHVTQARVVFIIVFGLATGSVVLAMFALQVFCLALCNGSCRQRNTGAGLSYFSMFLAFVVGSTLGLYQIDLRSEDKPDVISIKIGWSRYAVIGSSGAFLLAALLSVADYVRRHRLSRRALQKQAEAKTRLITVSGQVQQGQQQRERGPGARAPSEPPKSMGQTGNSQWAVAAMTATEGRPDRMARTVQTTMKAMAAENQRPSLGKNTTNGPRRPEGRRGNPGLAGGSKCITVDERTKAKDGKFNPGDRGPHRGERSRVCEEQSLAEAARKYKLTKSSHVESMEDKKSTLPAVEEGRQATRTGRNVVDIGDKKKSPSSASRPGGLTVAKSPGDESHTAVTNEATNQRVVKNSGKAEVKHVTSEDRKCPGKEPGLLEARENSRRPSTVEEALKNVRSMLASINVGDPRSDLWSEVKLPSASLNSSMDATVSPLKKRLPSIEESLSDKEMTRQKKRLQKLESLGTSQDSRNFTERDTNKVGKSRLLDITDRKDKMESRLSPKEESSSGWETQSKQDTLESADTDQRGDSKDQREGRKVEQRGEANLAKDSSLLTNSLSEEQIKRKLIVESITNSRRDRRKKRITQ